MAEKEIPAGAGLTKFPTIGTYNQNPELAEAFKKAMEESPHVLVIPEKPRWIPCSERLPEHGERVIVAIFGSDMIIPNEGETLQDAIERSRKEGYITVGFIGSDGWYGADWFPLMVQPSYWMPKPDLPEPPEKE